MRAAEVGPTVPIRVTCSCPGERSLPLRLLSDTLSELRLYLRGRMPASRPVLTYRCRHCKEVVVITAGQLYLADTEQLQIPLHR